MFSNYLQCSRIYWIAFHQHRSNRPSKFNMNERFTCHPALLLHNSQEEKFQLRRGMVHLKLLIRSISSNPLHKFQILDIFTSSASLMITNTFVHSQQALILYTLPLIISSNRSQITVILKLLRVLIEIGTGQRSTILQSTCAQGWNR